MLAPGLGGRLNHVGEPEEVLMAEHKFSNVGVPVALAFLLAASQPTQVFSATPVRHVEATGGGPVFQILPSPAVFRDQVPASMGHHLMADPTPFGNRVARISGTIHLEASDRGDVLLSAPPYTTDRADVEAEFTTPDGAKWKVVQTGVAARLPDGSPKLFAGVGTEKVVHGDSGKENPLMPKMHAALTMWGFADVYKNGKLVKRGALLHVMVTSRARSPENGQYRGYDVTTRPIEEIHLFLNPANKLPAPGGFLHVNWERSVVK